MFSVIHEEGAVAKQASVYKGQRSCCFHGLLLMQVRMVPQLCCIALHAQWLCSVFRRTGTQDAEGTSLCAQRSAESERSFSHSLDADASGHISRPAATYVARCAAKFCLIHLICMLCTSG